MTNCRSFLPQTLPDGSRNPELRKYSRFDLYADVVLAYFELFRKNVQAGISKHLVPAVVQLSGEFPTYRHYKFMGWMELDDRGVYASPQDCITANSKLAEAPSVELDQRLRDYGLQATIWQESLQAFDAVTKVWQPNLVSSLLAFALVQPFFPATAPQPVMHLVGTSGSDKSEIASLLSNFYGQLILDISF